MKKIRCRYFQSLLVFRAKTYALLLAACVIITPASFWAEEKAAQPLMLAKTYQSDIERDIYNRVEQIVYLPNQTLASTIYEVFLCYITTSKIYLGH